VKHLECKHGRITVMGTMCPDCATERRKRRRLLNPDHSLTDTGRETLGQVRTVALRLAELADFVLRHPCPSNLATACDAARDAQPVLRELLSRPVEANGADDE